MHERDVKAYLIRRVVDVGGVCRKVRWEGRNDAPDWLVILRRRTVLAELKATGEVPSMSQALEHEALTAAGAVVWVIDCEADVDSLIASYA
jgi:hypothetical protein